MIEKKIVIGLEYESPTSGRIKKVRIFDSFEDAQEFVDGSPEYRSWETMTGDIEDAKELFGSKLEA